MATPDTATDRDTRELTELNERFIEAFRQGSWEMLEPILTSSFGYLDGGTGEVWSLPRYIDALNGRPQPDLTIDEVAIHVAGDVAEVSARSRPKPGHYRRYLDSYVRTAEGWRCFHACVWPLATT